MLLVVLLLASRLRLLASFQHHGEHRKPIVTGCLEQCGVEETSCVTRCQVCVERHRCRSLHRCAPCHEEVKSVMIWKKIGHGLTMDNGSTSLLRDGMRLRLERAQFKAHAAHRKLGTARQLVLKAEREVEWAEHETKSKEALLREATIRKEDAKAQVVHWELRHARTLKKMRALAAEKRREIMKLEQQLSQAKKRHQKAKIRLRRAANNTIDKDSGRNKYVASEELEWKLRKEVQENRRAVRKAEKEYDQKEKDASWFHRGVKEKVKRAEAIVKEFKENLIEARAMERLARRRLERVKDLYLKVAKASNKCDQDANTIKLNMAKYRLPRYTPKVQPHKHSGSEKAGKAFASTFGVTVFLLTGIHP